MSEIDEIVGEFLVESYENLDRFDQDLLELERDPSDVDVLSSIFRTIHTVKGTSGFFGFDHVGALAHAAENLLGLLRDGDGAVTEDITSVLLATGDALRRMLGVIEATGEEGDEDVTDLIERLDALQRIAVGEAEGDAAEPEGDAAEPEGDAAEPEEAPARPLGEMLVERGDADEADITFAAHEQDLGDGRRLGEILVDNGQAEHDAVEAAAADQHRSAGRGIADTSIRVDVGLLDELMNLVGELVLARNQIVQLVTEEDQESRFAGASQRLNLITTELQEGVMKTRMQPIGNVWNKLPRVVRDLALECGKQVRLEMSGQDTELDKTIIEAIKDPLTHLVRNSVDHGIEDPARRLEAGKSEEGQVVLRAYHEGGQVNIEIADDGAGIDVARLRDKAVDKGVVTADQAARMGEREVLHLIFAPGFSTANEVTSVSGRGVGMDVVRTNIERIGGTVDVQTEPGAGTTFRVKIPLTLAIVPALIVTSAGDRFAIPQLSLIELLRLEGEQAHRGIESIHGVPVYRLRGQLLPIVDLAAELARGRGELTDRDVINIVVLHADGHQFGLVVDDIHDTQEIVVKPLGSHLKDASLFAGATIMGDGRVSLILDVLGIAQRAHVVSETRERRTVGDEDETTEASSERRTLLLVGIGDDRRAAVALAEVERLEEFAADAIEWAGGREVVQYRDDILPLLRLDQALGVPAVLDPTGELDVVVYAGEAGNVGLIVGRILDIVEQDVQLDGTAGRPGLLGSAVIQGRVTDVVDADALVAQSGLHGTAATSHLGA